MNCKTCNTPLTKKHQKTYCSNKCKLTSAFFKSRKQTKKLNCDTKIAVCKIDGWKTSDYNNVSGILQKHLNKIGVVITKPVQDYYTVEAVEPKKKIKCPACEFTTTDVDNKGGVITKHILNKHNTTVEDFIIKYPEIEKILYHRSNLLKYKQQLQQPENQVKCLVCNQVMMKITETHMQTHNMTVADYKNIYPNALIVSEYLSKELSKTTTEKNINSPIKRRSKAEYEIEQLLQSHGLDVIPNDRSMGVEIDLLIKSHSLGIEFNGLLYHSEKYGSKGRSYHIQKTKIANKNNIHLIQIFEDEWLNKKDIVTRKLLSLLGLQQDQRVYARKCDVREIDGKECTNFLNRNHIQGADKSPIRLGLFYNNALVAVATFSKLRSSLGQKNINKSDYELVRYATGCSVIGGMSKLVSHFLKHNTVNELISYADRRFTKKHNNVYESCGFTFIKESTPNYWYMKDYKKRLHRYNFTKSKIVQSLHGQLNLTEWENMVLMGYDRVWDCGSFKYSLTKKPHY